MTAIPQMSSPDPLTAAFAEAEAAGVTFVEGAEVFRVSDPNAAGPRTVTTTHGDYAADRIVLAAGSWSEDLGKMLDLRVKREDDDEDGDEGDDGDDGEDDGADGDDDGEDDGTDVADGSDDGTDGADDGTDVDGE